MSARLRGLSFVQLDPKNRKYAIDDLIMECASIHGCHLPSTDFYADRITSSVTGFILDFDYGDLTSDEMILALRLNVQGLLQLDEAVIQFSGITVNVAFLAKILKRYMVIRNIIDGKIKNKIDGCEY